MTLLEITEKSPANDYKHYRKNFVTRSVFDEVMPKILLVRFFSGHGVV